MGLFIPTPYIYGLPERVDNFRLDTTQGIGQPLRMQAMDVFPHDTYARESTYSSLPYLQGHSEKFDSNLLWLSASEMFIDIHNHVDGESGLEGRLVDFVVESGRMDIFLFGSASKDAPKRVQKMFAELVGY